MRHQCGNFRPIRAFVCLYGKEDQFYLQVLQMMAVARKILSLSKKSQQGNPGR
jgi:hypothetical protein